MIYYGRIFLVIIATLLLHIAQTDASVSGFVVYYLCYHSSCTPPPTLLSMTLIVRDDILRFTSCATFFTSPPLPKND